MSHDGIPVEEFKNLVGTELGPSGWLLIDQRRIDLFAEASGDYQYIHVDAEQAAKTAFGSTIAHGFLSLSLASKLVGEIMPEPANTVMGIIYGSDKVRFLQPVKVDSRVRARARLEKVSARPGGQLLVKCAVTIEIENQERPALIAEILSLYIIKDSP